jgi:putative phosphoribosyl transferase
MASRPTDGRRAARTARRPDRSDLRGGRSRRPWSRPTAGSCRHTSPRRKLARALASYKDQKPVILALPRGGVPVAAEVAAALKAPLDLILVRKVGVPIQPELAMGAVVDGGAPIVVRNENVIQLAGIDESEFKAICDSELAEIERRRQRYLGDRPRIDVAGRVAIVIDDGIATGATTRAALRATRMRNPSKLVLAVPVAPTDTLAAMREEADEVVCLEDYEFFGAIGFYYSDFSQTADQEVIETMARFPGQPANTAIQPAADRIPPPSTSAARLRKVPRKTAPRSVRSRGRA